MTPTEVEYLLDAYTKEYREKWEMVRLINHATIASNSTKSVKVQDVMKFPWDKETENSSAGMTQEEREEAVRRIKERFNIQDNG